MPKDVPTKVCETCGQTRWEGRQVDGYVDSLRADVERYREAWLARGRRINGVGEFVSEGAWQPIKDTRAQVITAVAEWLRDEANRVDERAANDIAAQIEQIFGTAPLLEER